MLVVPNCGGGVAGKLGLLFDNERGSERVCLFEHWPSKSSP